MFYQKINAITLLLYSTIICAGDTENTDVIEYCNDLRASRRLLLVSTLDGRLTALNIDDGGSEKWNVSTEPGPLLSSTIHNLELVDNSNLVRIIPSLSGGLYKFDGKSIEPMPVNTDTLLKSYWDEVDISGGKEVRSYAIDIESGSVLYECSMNDCKNWTELAYLNLDTILLRRETQKVRAIELQTRSERWNYSVGVHNVTITHAGQSECKFDSKKNIDFHVRAVVPEGLLTLINQADPNEKLWEHQFDSPIVHVWALISNHLEWIDLFKPVESLTKTEHLLPTLYIGVHNDQFYIQESEPLHRNQLLLDRSRFSMKKYRLIHALDIENKQDDVPLITDQSERNSTTALAMLYGSELVKGGYYLYCADSNGECQPKRGKIAVLSTFFLSSLIYWKEAFILLSVTFLLMHYLMPCPHLTIFNVVEIVKSFYNKLRKKPTTRESEEAICSDYDSGISSVVCNTECEVSSYQSRYKEDYEPIHCLGRGGFGVVFEVRNKIDDCYYAIKRITLPDKEEARDRVMREVRALAKLEHQHIVRYFQAWQECPPPGWQEEQDKLWKNKTKDEYLSTDVVSRTEATFSPSNISHNTSNIPLSFSISNSKNNLGIYNIPTSKVSDEKSDSFIVFKNSASENEKSRDHISKPSSTQSSYLIQRSSRKMRRKSSSSIPKAYLYIQMQLCQKNSLREWLCDNLERDSNVVLNMFDQIVQAVEYVHLQGMIHRDLKPSNIFFSPDGQIKVGDFGLVTEFVDADFITDNKKNLVHDEKHTANVGTELYMSPEQVLGKQYTYKVDIYSLGIILFELLTPFGTQMERHRALMNLRKNVFPSDFHVKHESEYELLRMMLSEQPEKRPTTFGIRSKPPFSKLRTGDLPAASADWHFDLPLKTTCASNLRKSSTESS